MSLYRNINKRKKAGTSRSKKKSTISPKAYANMKAGFPKAKKGGTVKKAKGMNKGGTLKKVPAGNTGLKKLPKTEAEKRLERVSLCVALYRMSHILKYGLEENLQLIIKSIMVSFYMD